MNLSDLRRGVPAALLAGLLTVGVAACGSEVATTSNSKAGGDSDQLSAGQMQDDGEVNSTITYTRSGGFAGFSDKVVVDPDGTVTIENKANPKPFTCTLKPEALGKLGSTSTAAAKTSAPQAEGKQVLRKPVPDEMYYSLQIGDKKFNTQLDVEYDQSVDDTFTLMHKVLASATALRDGTKVEGESLCQI